MSKSWKIPRRRRRCVVGEESFEPGTDYYSLLISENHGFTRADYCIACWEAYRSSDQWDPEATFWKAQIPKRIEKVRDGAEMGERTLELLRLALEDDLDAEAFILAQFLQRLRLLLLRQTTESDGRLCGFYEVVESSEVLMVPQVPLTTLEVASLQRSISSKLKGEPCPQAESECVVAKESR